MRRLTLAAAALVVAAAVALAAAGAHRVAADPVAADLWDTAVLWHAVSGLGLFACGAAWEHLHPGWRLAGCGLLLAGILGFSGSLYLQALTGAPPVPMAAPVGGSAMILGWLGIALAGLTGPR